MPCFPYVDHILNVVSIPQVKEQPALKSFRTLMFANSFDTTSRSRYKHCKAYHYIRTIILQFNLDSFSENRRFWYFEWGASQSWSYRSPMVINIWDIVCSSVWWKGNIICFCILYQYSKPWNRLMKIINFGRQDTVDVMYITADDVGGQGIVSPEIGL